MELCNGTSLEEQITCVKREVAMRVRVYPKRVAMDFMSEEQAKTEITRMRAVLATLESLFKPVEEQLDLISEESDSIVHYQHGAYRVGNAGEPGDIEGAPV